MNAHAAGDENIRMIAGVDIGGTKIAVGLVDEAGQVLCRAETPVHVDRGPEDALQRIVSLLQSQVKETGATIEGIGIGCTGPIDQVGGVLGNVNTLPGWEGWNPCEQLSAHLGVSAAMENDADAAALGEARLGAGRGVRSMICVTVGTGIGAGLILQGEIYRGANHSHPELGHHIIDPCGPLCTCGAYGCWESLACGPAMEQWYAAQAGLSTALDAKAICALARSGDAIALSAVARTARYLGLGLANVVSMFVPETIVLGGSIMRSADLFLPEIHRQLEQNCRLVPLQECAISVASLGHDVGLIGAAQVWNHRFKTREGI